MTNEGTSIEGVVYQPNENYVYWIDPGHYAEITTNEDRFRKSTVDAQMKLGVPGKEAQDYANKINFYFGKGEQPSDESSFELGSAGLNSKTGRYECNLYIDRITSALNELAPTKTNKPSLEVTQLSIQQALDHVWRHERQHLVDYTDPKLADRITKSQKLTGNLLRASFSGVILSSGAYLATQVVEKLPNANVIEIASLSGVIATGVLTHASLWWWVRASAHERRAQTAAREDDKDYRSPFEIKFYNYGKKSS